MGWARQQGSITPNPGQDHTTCRDRHPHPCRLTPEARPASGQALRWTPPRSSLFLLSWTARIIISGQNWSPGVLDSKPTLLSHLPSSFSFFLLPKQEAGAQRVAVMWLWSRFQTASPWGAV